MSTYKLGLVSVSFRNHSPEEILVAMKSAGLSVIEWGSDVHAPKDHIQNLHTIVELQKKYGIDCCSYGTYFRLGQTPIEELQGYIEAAKILGTNVLRVWCGDKDSEKYTDEEKKALFHECQEAAKLAQENDVVLCMECHNHTFTNSLDAALELMKAVNSVHFRMYWQPNQYKLAQENLAYAAGISPSTEHLHVFNWKGDERYPLCDAKQLWKDYLCHFGKDKTLLLEFMPDDRIETLAAEAQTLFEIVEEEV